MRIVPIGGRLFSTRLLAVATLGVGGVVGFWMGLEYAGGARLLPAAALVIGVALSLLWLFRIRAREQSQAIWNAYADREIERARYGTALRRRQDLAKRIFSRRNFDARPQSQTR